MTESKQKPGPWVREFETPRSGREYMLEDELAKACVRIEQLEQQRADLLEACQFALDVLGPKDQLREESLWALHDSLSAAIAKAKGG